MRCVRDMACAPQPNRTDSKGNKLPPPTHRYPSTSTPWFYVKGKKIRTEDDVIYRPNLPTFADNPKDGPLRLFPVTACLSGQVLGQRDSELLLSFLTVPYIR